MLFFKIKSGIQVLIRTALFLGAILFLPGCTKIANTFFVKNYTDPWHKKVAEAGIKEKQVQIGQVTFNYAEGPNNGPPLLLLHAQMMSWYSYSRVLPQLSKSFHVFALDYNGHGETKAPIETFNADSIGTGIATFMQTVIKEPAFVTGNSSGGLLTVWLAANKPGLVKAIVLEDPPLFSAEYPRVKTTIAYKSFITCHNYITEGRKDDFLAYWLQSNSAFVEKHAGKKALPMILSSIQAYHTTHPGKPVEIGYLPDVVRLLVRGMSRFDPHFGDAFYTGSWNQGFDHKEALQKIKCPTLLLQANFGIRDDGILDGAMTQQDADQAIALVKNSKYQKVNASHVVHAEKPALFIQIIKSFFLDKQ